MWQDTEISEDLAASYHITTRCHKSEDRDNLARCTECW